MDPLSVLFIIVGFYVVLIFFDLFFKSCAHYPYLRLLDGLGLNIGYFSIKWNTKALNRLILKWGTLRPQFLKWWFSIGVYISLCFLPISIIFLFYSFFHSIYHRESNTTPLISPVIPGVNLPISELGYYSVTLLICSVIHEMGHALAAVVEDLGVLEFGCNIYFILPVAYVTIQTEKLKSLKVKNRLSIFCAGVWHNIWLFLVAYLVYFSLPTVFSPLFNTGSGVSISHIDKNSPLAGSLKGLFYDDVIVEINSCKIKNEDDWYTCLSDLKILQPAVCIDSDLVHTLDESVPLKHLGNGYVECCDPTNSKNVCFEYIDIENNELELPAHVCLPGRTVMEKAVHFCTSKPHTCVTDSYCFRPILPNSTFLFKIVCQDKFVIYLGHPNDLYQTIEVSSYIKKGNLISTTLPIVVTKLVKYIIIISLGLAFLNILPFMYMDGEYIIRVLGLICLKNKIGQKNSVLTVTVTIWLFSLLLAFYLFYSVILLLM